MKKRTKSLGSLLCVAALTVSMVAGCGSSASDSTSAKTESGGSEETTTSGATSTTLTNEQILKKAAADGKVGNWGLGNEYEIYALLNKYGLPTQYLSQDFTMDGFDDDSITLASANTYNEVGLVKNDYDGAYGYGDTVGVIDLNAEGVAMLQDNIFCTREFAEQNPNTVKAFLYASIKGWEYALEHPDEAIECTYNNGSTLSEEHQEYMADETIKLVTTDMKGNTVSDIGNVDMDAMTQTLDIAKQYVKLEDASAQETLENIQIEDFCDTSYLDEVKNSVDGNFGEPEKKQVSMQLKWLSQAQFMGYFVALDKGFYDEVGLEVSFVQGGGDVAETTAVYNGTVDFGTTYVGNLVTADAAGMGLLEVAQIFQSSGMRMIYKYDNFQTE